MVRSKNRLLVFMILFITIAPIISGHEENGGHTSISKNEKSHNDIKESNKNEDYWGGGGGGGGSGSGGGGTYGGGGGGGGSGGGGGTYGGGGGWGWGGGGGGWWGWGCRRSSSAQRKHGHKRVRREMDGGDYKMGEFAQCMGKGRCHGMRLDCPLHCGGPCFYDCKYMCKSHCHRH